MSMFNLERVNKYSDWAPLVLRVALGIILIIHGYDKLFTTGVSNVAGFFTSMNVPMPVVSAWIASIIEFVGGIFLVVGFLTRWTALAITVQFLVILYLKIFQWNASFMGQGSYEYDLLIFAVALALFLRGAGIKLSLDKKFF